MNELTEKDIPWLESEAENELAALESKKDSNLSKEAVEDIVLGFESSVENLRKLRAPAETITALTSRFQLLLHNFK